MAVNLPDDEVNLPDDERIVSWSHGYAKCFLQLPYSIDSVILGVNQNIESQRIPLPEVFKVTAGLPRKKPGNHLNPIVGCVQITKKGWGTYPFEYGITDLQPVSPNSKKRKRKVPCIRSIQFTENLPASGGAVHVALLFYDWNCGIVVVWSVLPDCSIREPTGLGGLRHI